MKIAIHNFRNTFSTRWIEYCKENNIDYKLVNPYNNNILEQLEDCDAFMWHFSQEQYKDALFAKQLMFSLQMSGKKVFPDINTCWHFDDKVGEKYLYEAIGAKIVPSYVFYSKKEAIDWIETTTFPKVFKLRGGAGAQNVKLVKNKRTARKLIRKAFSNGISQYNRWEGFKDRFIKWTQGNGTFFNVCKGFAFLFITKEYAKMHGKEKGYVYFQDFIPDNDTDFRIKVVNGNCWGFQRKVRKNDFRASGSGVLIFDKNQIPIEMVKIAQNIAKRLSFQSIAFDFIIDKKTQKPLLVESSFCFGFDDAEMVNGYWDQNLNWHSEKFNPFGWMIESLFN